MSWVKLHRKIQSNPLWTSEPFTRGQAWVDLILLANYKKGFIRARGIRVDIERGQVGMSHVNLSKRWDWSRGKVKRFLNELEIDQQIVQQNNNVSCLISIVNYNEYQTNDTADETQNDTADEQQTGQQTSSKQNTNKNDNNKNNEKKERENRFENAWQAFGRVGNKKKAFEYWQKLTIEQIESIEKVIPHYLIYLGKTDYSQKYFEGWINPKNELWKNAAYTNQPQPKPAQTLQEKIQGHKC